MKVSEGSINDILEHLEMIRSAIPEKANLDEEEVRRRLEGRVYGVLLAQDKGETRGLFVWYENEARELYLWLGVTREPGKSDGSTLMKELERRTSYATWRVKTSRENEAALRLLGKYGFRVCTEEEGVLQLRRQV